jgi:SAM-dependent methyltransferase
MNHAMYDSLSADYDRFVDWPARLALEIPFLERELRSAGARSVLDSACGTGMHAIALAACGFTVTGADFSAGMVARARENAAAAGAGVRFEPAGFGEMAEVFGAGSFDALLCLGNSLPHARTPALLDAALRDFASCLQPGGLLVLQNRNFDAILSRRERWMPPQARRENGGEWLFLRCYDFEPDGTLTFQMVMLRRRAGGEWSQRVDATRLLPLRREMLVTALSANRFEHLESYGDMRKSNFDPEGSGDLLMLARSAYV